MKHINFLVSNPWSNIDSKIKKSALQIIKNINSRGHKSKGQFSIPNLNLADSSLQF